jgi:flagellar biosynthesis/type III secretory pathway chaperone
VSVLKPLFTTVEAMLHEHEQLLELSKRKKEVLIEGDMKALNEIVNQEAAHVHRIERLEAERMGAGRLLAARLGLPIEELTATRVSALANSPEEAERIVNLTDRLRAVVLELQSLNELNRKLIEQSLSFVRTSIEVLTESPQVPTYGAGGQAHAAYQQNRTSLFDSKA